jgi:putative ABC transport system substrate-binding protein
LPVVGYIGLSNGADALAIAAFRKGLSETGYVEGQNVSVEYHWLDVTTHCRFDGPNCLFRI